MSPEPSVARLLALEKLGIKFGLENIQAICAALQHPERAYPTVIVAGTNGKGSVTAMVDTALGATGRRSGRYTSPHLVRLEERFVYGGREIDPADLESVAGDVLDRIDELVASGTLASPPTFFEATTAIAFELFRRAGVDIAVLEVGLGGRLDATNAAAPLVGAVTTIGLDHERFLGTTIREIAFEKAGIVKPGMRIVLGEDDPEVVDVISRVCAERGASLSLAFRDVETDVRRSHGDSIVTLRTPTRSYGPVPLALKGRHQIQNAVTAVRMLEEIDRAGLAVTREAVEHALMHTAWRGRLDERRLPDGRSVLFDAAHNPAGARALASYLQEAELRTPMVFGVMRDKNAEAMLEALCPRAASLVATEPRNARARSAGELAALARRVAPALPIEVDPDPRLALDRAWRRDRRVVVCGSIFLVGELIERIAPAD